MLGIGGSPAPAVLGSALLTLGWLVAAVGRWRLSVQLSEVPAESPPR